MAPSAILVVNSDQNSQGGKNKNGGNHDGIRLVGLRHPWLIPSYFVSSRRLGASRRRITRRDGLHFSLADRMMHGSVYR